MFFRNKYKSQIGWGYELSESDCHCDYDNVVYREKKIFFTEKERDKKLQERLESSNYCVKKYNIFCTTLNKKAL